MYNRQFLSTTFLSLAVLFFILPREPEVHSTIIFSIIVRALEYIFAKPVSYQRTNFFILPSTSLLFQIPCKPVPIAIGKKKKKKRTERKKHLKFRTFSQLVRRILYTRRNPSSPKPSRKKILSYESYVGNSSSTPLPLMPNSPTRER